MAVEVSAFDIRGCDYESASALLKQVDPWVHWMDSEALALEAGPCRHQSMGQVR